LHFINIGIVRVIHLNFSTH